jgi:hypothetical protein
MFYSQEQRIWMIKKFYKTNSARKVTRQWIQKFTSQPPDHKTVLFNVTKFEKTGSVKNRQKKRPKIILTTKTMEKIQTIFAKYPHLSIRKAAS